MANLYLDNIEDNIEWKIFQSPQDYEPTLLNMQKTTENIANNHGNEEIWLLTHNHVYTKGISANDNELINTQGVQVVAVGRGGKFTYHGPGQKIIYPLLNLNNRGKDLKKYINNLEQWIILVLKDIGINAYNKQDFIGVWVTNNNQEQKIASIGVRVSKWITSHGIALNVNPDLNYFKGIVPCGIKDVEVTSIAKLGIDITDNELNKLLQKNFYKVFSVNNA